MALLLPVIFVAIGCVIEVINLLDADGIIGLLLWAIIEFVNIDIILLIVDMKGSFEAVVEDIIGFIDRLLGIKDAVDCLGLAMLFHDGNAENTLSMPESSIGNLLMPADLLQKAAILPAKTQIVQANINSDEALSLMADLFYPKDFTMTSLTTIIIDHRQSIPKLFPKKLAVPGANQFALGGTCS
uniref:Uncharacterized protein n=1 Tax=Magallana gigas TaxID=29159 RepID=K1QVI4_MAGGI